MATILTAHGPEDLLAAVPVILGFAPTDSVVLLTFRAEADREHGFSARVDLPADAGPDGLAAITEALLAPAVHHRTGHAAFVLYTADRAHAAAAAAVLVPAFLAAGIGVVDVLRADDGRWARVPMRRGVTEAPAVAYDAARHPFRAQAVLAGRVTHTSREQLRLTVARDEAGATRLQAAVEASGSGGEPDVESLLERVATWVQLESGPDDAEAADLLRWVSRVEVRDALLYTVTHERASAHLALWVRLLRIAPDGQVPDVAAMAAFCAWLTGDGALAWCALDRALALDPEHRLSRCLADALTQAMPPSVWDDASPDFATPLG